MRRNVFAIKGNITRRHSLNEGKERNKQKGRRTLGTGIDQRSHPLLFCCRGIRNSQLLNIICSFVSCSNSLIHSVKIRGCHTVS